MRYPRLFKIFKICIAIVIIFVSFIVFEEIFTSWNKYNHYSKILHFIWNNFHETYAETDNFKVDINKADWHIEQDGKIAFVGTLVYLDKNLGMDLSELHKLWFGKPFYVDALFTKDKGFYPIILATKITENELLKLSNFDCNKSYKQINDWNATIYDFTTKYTNIPIRYVIYKDELFDLIPYIDEFKPQYDKFFEGVWLKE
jgi:hypothetical protein